MMILALSIREITVDYSAKTRAGTVNQGDGNGAGAVNQDDGNGAGTFNKCDGTGASTAVVLSRWNLSWVLAPSIKVMALVLVLSFGVISEVLTKST